MTEELIERFFKKQCTPDEALEVAEFLRSDPATLDNYLSQAEWNELDTKALMPDDYWNDVWDGIQKKKESQFYLFWLKYTSIAACIILSLGLGYHLVRNKIGGNNELAKNIHTENKSDLACTTQRKKVENASAKTLCILLVDGSKIILSPHSAVSYDVPFLNNKRDVFLEGEAVFKVAHDRAKPFTVYAGGLATTALGTTFKVTHTDGKFIAVKLFDGEVLIKRTNTNLKGWSKNIYLLPGEQMKYDLCKKVVAVTAIEGVLNRPAGNILYKKEVVKNYDDLVFSSAPLHEVIDKLAKYYNRKIVFDSTRTSAINFTGTITKNDSLSVILKVIGQMNDLDIIQQGDDFYVKKLPE